MPPNASDSNRPQDEKRAWNKAALPYSRFILRGDPLREELLNPTLVALADDVHNRSLLDAGCGQGYLARFFADRGASAVGIDASETMISVAKKTYGEHKRLAFLHADLKKKLSFPDRSFDLVVANMVLMDVDPIDGTMKEFRRVLARGGSFIFSILHPAFMNGVLTTPILTRLFSRPPSFRIDRYHTPVARSWTIQGVGVPTPFYHRPIEFYARALKESGFAIVDIREPVLAGIPGERRTGFYALCEEIPPFLVVKAAGAT